MSLGAARPDPRPAQNFQPGTRSLASHRFTGPYRRPLCVKCLSGFSSELVPDGSVSVRSAVVGWCQVREWLGRRAGFRGVSRPRWRQSRSPVALSGHVQAVCTTRISVIPVRSPESARGWPGHGPGGSRAKGAVLRRVRPSHHNHVLTCAASSMTAAHGCQRSRRVPPVSPMRVPGTPLPRRVGARSPGDWDHAAAPLPGLAQGHIMAVMADLAPVAQRYLRIAADEAHAARRPSRPGPSRSPVTRPCWQGSRGCPWRSSSRTSCSRLCAGTGPSRTTANADVTQPESNN